MTDNVLAAERNQQDETMKHAIQFRILKCREFGDATGVAGIATYNPNTGRLIDGMCNANFERLEPVKPLKKNLYENEELPI